jgi:hypothetical protein
LLLGATRRKQANLHSGDRFLISKQGNQLVLTPLELEAEKMREELRAMLQPGGSMSDEQKG